MAYHRANARRSKRVHRKLERFGEIVYWLSLGLIILRAMLLLTHAGYADIDFHKLEKILNILCIALPALAAVAYAFAEQGGFERLEQRSEAMMEDLQVMKNKLEQLPPDGYRELRTMAEKIASLMISEVSDWRIFVKSKEIRSN